LEVYDLESGELAALAKLASATGTPVLTYQPAMRLAVVIMFFINGAVLANWVSRIPAIAGTLHLDEGAVGLVLIGLSIGVITSLLFTGGLIARFGSERVVQVAAVVLCLALPLLALAPNPVLLWVALFGFGAALSTMDVAMNSQAVEVEQRAARPLMSSFHGAFSVGSFAGALMGGIMASLGVMPLVHFVIAAIGFALLSRVAITALVRVDAEVSGRSQRGSPIQLPPRALWMVGAIALCAMIGEGSAADWSGLYIQNIVGLPGGVTAFGYAAFAVMMTVGRLSGDWLVSRFQPAPLVRVGGLIACLGILVAVVSPSLLTAVIGFAAVGAGLSLVVPLAFSAAGRVPGVMPGAGIAGVATIGYAGLLAGPPIIGLIAHVTSLQVGLLFVAVMVGTLAFTGQRLKGTP
jgi:predicted MFS family arabinose efflux permease